MRFRSILILSVAAAFFTDCNETGIKSEAENKVPTKQEAYGEKFDSNGAITTAELKQKLDTEKGYKGAVKGEVAEVCQAEGCWLKLAMADGSQLHVMMKDHAFLLPKDIAKSNAIIMGEASWDTTSVEDLRHYAEDAGKSKEEIAAITEPEIEPVFEATGVIIKKD